ncbi:uncharacterized protein LOC118811072 [Colossoma macropomum]|uniref:uncharacterized protein LOC118811072 n=1 Tax=Colossoma macropomum TaxID=42526 RepID=UPI001863D078|nr:uncharacterized protein LOC118811072 [Colossoma macropomum]
MRWRPLLCVAGAAVAAGAVYYFYRCRNRHQRTREDPDEETVNEAAIARTSHWSSPLQPASRPASNASSASQGAPEAAGYMSPQSPHIPSPRAPSVAPSPSQPPFEPQQEADSTQSVFWVSGDAKSPQNPPRTPPQVPSIPQAPFKPQPEPASSIQRALGAAGDLTVPPEVYRVPALYDYFAARRTTNFPLKLSALRQAFTIVLSNSHHSKCVIIADRVLLGGLATRNARVLPDFHPACHFLVAVAQDASHREAICTELAQIGIQHFSFIDIIYELVLMRALQGARPPIFPTPGGFLGHLMAMVFSLSPVSIENRARAEQYLFLLQDEALLLLDDIFGGEEHVYQNPGSLALALWDCLEKHVRQLLLRLQAA